MPTTVTDRLADVHPQMLRMESEGARKKIGLLVERAIELLHLTKQDVAFRLHYSDAGVISRWCTAVERPLFDKLWSLDGFDGALVLAIAEGNPRIEVSTIVTIRRTA
jgi:hypothetical protein